MMLKISINYYKKETSLNDRIIFFLQKGEFNDKVIKTTLTNNKARL